jgi:hypothetical protein
MVTTLLWVTAAGIENDDEDDDEAPPYSIE